jgi:hypothetical protein
MFSRLSHVQGPVENHAQIPERIFVMEGGTANIKNRNIFTSGVEVHNFGTSELTCTTLEGGYTALNSIFRTTSTTIMVTIATTGGESTTNWLLTGLGWPQTNSRRDV